MLYSNNIGSEHSAQWGHWPVTQLQKHVDKSADMRLFIKF
jgi:hypothetical protein